MAVKKSKKLNIDSAIRHNIKKNKQVLWIIGGMIGLLILFFVFYFIFQSTAKFKFEGLTFTKEKYGTLPVYHYYYTFDMNNHTFTYNLYLRLDPRKSVVEVEKQSRIVYELGKFTFISVNGTGLEKCSDSSLAIGELASFLANNFLQPTGAVPDKEMALANNLTYATCQNQPERTVILIQAGNETRVDVGKDGRRCNVITVANCEILQATERFIIESIVDAKKGTEEEQESAAKLGSGVYQ